MTCELNEQFYFFLEVTDEDFLKESDSEKCDFNLAKPMFEEGN